MEHRCDPAYQVLAGTVQPVCIMGSGQVRTQADLLRAASALADELSPSRAPAKVVVGCKNRYALATALLAAWSRGHSAILPPALTDGAIAEALALDGIVGFLHDLDREEGSRVETSTPNTAQLPTVPLVLPSTQKLITLYTSGTTGPSKAIHKCAGQLLGEARLHLRHFELHGGLHVVSSVPSHHIYGLLFGLLLPLLGDGTFEDSTPFFPETIRERTRDHDRCVLVTVPAHLTALAHLDAGDLARVQRAFCSTAPLHQEDALAFHSQHQVQLIEIFGSTETGGIAWRSRPDQLHWRPLPGVQVSADATKRLLLNSPLLPEGEPRPYPCQDRIEWNEDGTFQHLGRTDDVLKVGGKRVSIAHMEDAISEVTGVHGVVLIRRERGGGRNEELRALVASTTTDEDRIRAELSRTFDPTVLPRRIRVVPELPRLAASSELDMELVAEMLADGSSSCWAPERTALPPLDEIAESETGVFQAQFSISPASPYFQGHFPGHPVLPGITQLHELVLPQLRRLRPAWGEPTRLARMKFRQQIRPEDLLHLQIRLDDARHLAVFQVEREGDLCSSGRIYFEAPSS